MSMENDLVEAMRQRIDATLERDRIQWKLLFAKCQVWALIAAAERGYRSVCGDDERRELRKAIEIARKWAGECE